MICKLFLRTTALFILRKIRFNSHNFKICQGLEPGAFEQRLSFCECYTRACEEGFNFPSVPIPKYAFGIWAAVIILHQKWYVNFEVLPLEDDTYV